MIPTLTRAETRNLNKPDEVRTFPKGKVEIFEIGGKVIGRATFEPGWRWSTSVKPIVKTERCEVAHFQYILSGTIAVEMDDGTRFECKAGDIAYIPAGHEAWVVGNKTLVALDFEGLVEYAKP